MLFRSGKLIPAGTGMQMYRNIEVTDKEGNPLTVDNEDDINKYADIINSQGDELEYESVDDVSDSFDDDEPIDDEGLDSMLNALDSVLDSETRKESDDGESDN